MKKFLFFLVLFSFPARAEQITVSFILKQKIPIQTLAENVLDPKNPRYGVYYTVDEIRESIAPNKEDYDRFLTDLQKSGLKIMFQSKSRLVISVRGEHTFFESTFHTRIKFAHKGKYHKNTVVPRIPQKWSYIIKSISGFSNTRQSNALHKKVGRPVAFGDPQPGILPDTIKKVYGFDEIYKAGLTGKDQDIAIATYFDFSMDDVIDYYKIINLSPTPTVDRTIFNGPAEYDSGSAAETELDAEFAGMIAPGSNIHVHTSAENSDQGELVLFTSILDYDRAKIVSYSWGSCETAVDPSHRKDMDDIFARAIAEGINIFVASGDSGSDGCGDGGRIADWPALHPYVTAVGGSSLTIDRKGFKHEVGWSGSGGGFSNHYPLPQWQSGLKAPFVTRSFPDVTFNADPESGEAMWIRPDLNSPPAWQVVGGTSMAAPQWAAFLALVNEARKDKGFKTIGFLNPILYGATPPEKIAIFVDITSGNNGLYTAKEGWDAVTGWGSMRAYAMLDFLSSK